MDESVRVPLLGDILPGGLRFGANYLVEFEPQSLWFETSLTLCAQALRMGFKTDYHTFTHPPNDVRRQLGLMGVDVKKEEKDGTFRIIDSYAVQTGAGAPDGTGQEVFRVDMSSLKMMDWDKGSLEVLKSEAPEADKRRFHVDDNTSVLVQFNDESSVTEHFRKQTVPFARHLELAAIHSVAAGVFSDSFYRQFESFCDGILDFRAQDQGEKVAHSMRVRVARGSPHDSTWRPIDLGPTGEVAVSRKPEGKEVQVPEGEVERHLAAIMFTDTVGFTALGQRDEALMMRLIQEQRSLVRPVFARFRGREVKSMGDGFLVEFVSALDAVRCALELQGLLKKENMAKPEGTKMLVRVGIHLGDVIHTGSDVAGDAINVASRIEPLARPGGICVSEQVYYSVANKVECKFETIGRPQLKNVSFPVEVYRISEFGQEVQQSAPRGGLPKDRIAILPFKNISLDTADEYFADGMTEELISSVSKTKGLRVIARTSVMRYKGLDKPISEIGKELNVGSVLEGSVRKAGEKVRVTVQLVETADEEPTWSQEYDREVRDIFGIQSDIAKRVTEALQEHLLGGVHRQAEGRTTGNTEAYVAYLRGRQAWNKRTHDELKKAIGFFESALQKDPGFAKGYTGLADAYATLALLEFVAPKEAYPKAKDAVGKALALDPQLAEAHTSLGLIRFQYDWDWAGAEAEFEEAIKLNPSYAPAHHYYADYLKAMGRFEEALREIAAAQELDPLNLAINTGVGHVLYLSGQYDRAIEQYRRAVELDPNFMLTHIWFGRPYLEKGMYRDAISELEAGVRLSGDSTVALAMLGHGLASAGRKDEALDILEKLKGRAETQYVPSYWVAVVYNGFRDRDKVVEWMKRAYEERSSWLVWSNVEPRFAWLLEDKEFSGILSAMNFPKNV